MAGFDVEQKAEKAIQAVKNRLKSLDIELEEFAAEYIGINSCFGPIGTPTNPHLPENARREIVVRLGVKDHSQEKLKRFAKEIAPLLTSGPAGITGFAAGRAAIAPVVVYWPTLIERHLVQAQCEINGNTFLEDRNIYQGISFSIPPQADDSPRGQNQTDSPPKSANNATNLTDPIIISKKSQQTQTGKIRVPLLLLAYARSGDKGEASNVGIVARTPELYPILEKELTEANVKNYFQGIALGKVTCYKAPNIHALNFILGDSLGGGGASSLKNDAQGKTHGQIMLYYPIEIESHLIPDSVWKKKYLTLYPLG